jgi:hypothetical protein
MDTESPRVSIDIDARVHEGTIISTKLSGTKLMKIKVDNGPTIVRHADRVAPLNDAAKKFLRAAP